ncbi:MAG: hypothetical protein PHP37_00115 [Patescibacteria group bacterium]|nr:hypothetical protein [Patescibacteria group bacterium]
MKKDEITIIKPFDAHVHLRSGDLLKAVISCTTNNFSNAVVMGNLLDPVDDLNKALLYRQEIMSNVPAGHNFKPLMSVMLNKNSSPEKIEELAGIVQILKFIPGATSTNSEAGISFFDLCDFREAEDGKYSKVLEAAEAANMVFSIHAELINDAFGNPIPEEHREFSALPFVKRIIAKFPKLKIVIEHVSTSEACRLVEEAPDNVVATVTLHHLLLTDQDVYDDSGNIKNIFNYCKPVAKRARDLSVIRESVFSGNKKFFFGSDSAPHLISTKLEKGAAGIFTAPIALQKLTEIFADAGHSEMLENFVSIYGREFYGLPIPEEKVTLIRERHKYPEEIGGVKILGLTANELEWKRKI